MKKLLVILLAITCALGLVACNDNKTPPDNGNDKSVTISLNVESKVLNIDQGLQLHATCSDSAAEIVWSSQNNEIATVSESGYVTAKSVGATKILATYDEVSAACDIEVVGAKYVPVLEVSSNDVTLFVGGERTIEATLTLGGVETAVDLDWSSNNPSVATVENGKIKGVAVGSAEITVSGVYNEEPVSQTITVNVLSAKVFYIEQDDVELAKTAINVGDISTITLTYYAKENGEDLSIQSIEWESSNDDIATVSNSGLVTAVDKGEARINATCTLTDGTVLKAWKDVSVYKSKIEDLKITSSAEVSAQNEATVSANELGYTASENESVVATIDGKNYDGAITDGLITFGVDGYLYGEKEYTLEVGDRIFDVQTEFIAKTVQFTINRYVRDNGQGEYVKVGEPEVDSQKLNADLVSYFEIYNDYVLNAKKCKNVSLKEDGTAIVNLYYDKALKSNNADVNALLYRDFSGDGSADIAVDYNASVAGTNCTSVTFASASSENCLRVAGISPADAKANGYRKLSFKFYMTDEFTTTDFYFKTSYPTDIGTTATYELKFNAANLSGSNGKFFRLIDEAGNIVYDVVPNTWMTLEVSLHRYSYPMTGENGMNVTFYLGKSNSVNVPLYIKDFELSRKDMALVEKDGVAPDGSNAKVVTYTDAVSKNDLGGNYIKLFDETINDVVTNNYKKLTMKIMASSGYDASNIFVYAKWKNDIGTTSQLEIRLNNGNIGSGTPSTLFAMYDKDGNRIYDVPTRGEWFTLEINMYRYGYIMNDINGVLDMYMFDGRGTTLNQPLYIKDIAFSTEPFAARVKETILESEEVTEITYAAAAQKTEWVDLFDISTADITQNGYKKITMKIKAGTGFDASTIFINAKWNNDIGTVSEHTIRLNSANIGSNAGTPYYLFAMYDKDGVRIYDVPAAGEWFTLEISLYRAGYLVTETNGELDIHVYMGNANGANKTFYIKDVTYSTENF